MADYAGSTGIEDLLDRLVGCATRAGPPSVAVLYTGLWSDEDLRGLAVSLSVELRAVAFHQVESVKSPRGGRAFSVSVGHADGVSGSWVTRGSR